MDKLLSQARAAYALERVSSAAKQPNRDDYARLCRRLPAMIIGNGIGQAMAFIRADAGKDVDKASYRLYSDLSEWVLKHRHVYDGQPDLLPALTQGNRSQYLLAQQECLELLGWLKRFADAFIGKGND